MEESLSKDEDGKVLRSEKGSPIQARDSKGKLMWNDVTDSEKRKLSRDSFGRIKVVTLPTPKCKTDTMSR